MTADDAMKRTVIDDVLVVSWLCNVVLRRHGTVESSRDRPRVLRRDEGASLGFERSPMERLRITNESQP